MFILSISKKKKKSFIRKKFTLAKNETEWTFGIAFGQKKRIKRNIFIMEKM